MNKLYPTTGHGLTTHSLDLAANGLRRLLFSIYVKRMLMRINLVVLFLGFFFLQEGFAARGQNVTLTRKNTPLVQLFREIRKQTGYDFVITNAQAKIAKPVSITVSGTPLIEVLDKCFAEQPFGYAIENKTVVVVPLKAADKVAAVMDVKGRVVDEMGKPLQGAVVKVKGNPTKAVLTDVDGYFILKGVNENQVLVVSFLGYMQREIAAQTDLGTIRMAVAAGELDAVSVVSTGYQQIPKERATGSFGQINNALLNRRISANILDKIENVVPGILFDRTSTAPDPLSIRGRSTIMADATPLIIVDNFPFDGPITDINTNDVESVTILKDAAAASIWGARAGNGVIVITTKKGTSRTPHVSFSSNITFVPRPDISSLRTISSSDYIDLEKNLFSKGYYSADEVSPSNTALSPVVELLIAKRDNKISAAAADAQIEALKNINGNEQISRYLTQSTISQQHQLNFSGNTPSVNYYFSVGWDRPGSTLAEIGSTDRISLRSTNTFQVTKNFAVEAGINYIQSDSKFGNNPGFNLTAGGTRGIYPYVQLADENGNPLAITYNYRNSFINSSMQKGLLDWTYSPLAEFDKSETKVTNRDIVLRTALKYKILPVLNAAVIYQYQSVAQTNDTDYGKESYYTRNLINQYMQTGTGGVLTRIIPLGDIRRLNNSYTKSNQARAQLSYDQAVGRSNFSAIAGMEIREERNNGYSDQFYGYNPISSTIVTSIDYTRLYPQYNNPTSSASIPNIQNYSAGTIDHFWSYFANASYSFDGKYILSGSARTDASNLFGVKTNQKGVPLWSAGIAWQADKEGFYKVDWMPRLKLRATYGVQGNFSRATSALTTASYSSTSTGMVYAKILNPPNESLRWEKVKMLNLGIDFGLKRDVLTGSFEYYVKRASDLMGTAPIDPTAGLADEAGNSVFLGNIANMAGHGFDVQLSSKNLSGQLQWSSTALFSYTASYVSKYFMPISVLGRTYLNSSLYNPIEGKPLYSIYAYPWAGLDGQTGDPMGYVSGQQSRDYAKILSSTSLADMVYGGNRTPEYYGSLRNDWNYKNFSLSCTISFKAGYYFRRSSIDYASLFTRWTGSSDYASRWQVPGDESRTNVPSLVYPANANRDSFYTNSAILIEKGDHVRLEDIAVGYDLNKRTMPRLPFTQARISVYANNLGILWRANKFDLDPNYLNIPTNTATLALGINLTL